MKLRNLLKIAQAIRRIRWIRGIRWSAESAECVESAKSAESVEFTESVKSVKSAESVNLPSPPSLSHPPNPRFQFKRITYKDKTNIIPPLLSYNTASNINSSSFYFYVTWLSCALQVILIMSQSYRVILHFTMMQIECSAKVSKYQKLRNESVKYLRRSLLQK